MGGAIDLDPAWVQLHAKAQGISLPEILPFFSILEGAYITELGKKKKAG